MNDSLGFDLCWFLPFEFGLNKGTWSCFTPVCCCTIVSPSSWGAARFSDKSWLLQKFGFDLVASWKHFLMKEKHPSELNLSKMPKTSESMWENMLWSDETKVQLSWLQFKTNHPENTTHSEARRRQHQALGLLFFSWNEFFPFFLLKVPHSRQVWPQTFKFPMRNVSF